MIEQFNQARIVFQTTQKTGNRIRCSVEPDIRVKNHNIQDIHLTPFIIASNFFLKKLGSIIRRHFLQPNFTNKKVAHHSGLTGHHKLGESMKFRFAKKLLFKNLK